MSGNANGTSLVTVVVTPRDRYTGTVECIDTLYEYTWSPFNLLVLDLGYPRGLLKKVRQALRGRPGADLVSLGRIIPMEAFRSILPRIDTGYIVFLDNDSRVTPGWLEPLLECAAAGANVVTPLTLEREGLDEGAPLRNHIYTSELRQVEVEKVPYLIEYKPYRREPPEKLPRHQAPTDLFELHCVFIETEYLRRIELRPMVVREHIDMAMQLRRAGARLMAEPRSVIIFDNLNQRMALPDMRFFFFRWGAGLLEQSERLFERTWGYRFYSEQSMRNWAFRRKVYLLARYFHVPNRYANYLTNGLNRLRQQWDPLPDPIGSSRPFFEEAPARTAHNAVGAAGGA